MSGRLRGLVRAPLWPLQVVSGAKSFVDNPLLGSSWLNARGLHARRVALAHRLAAARRQRLAQRIPADDRAAFDRDGFVIRRDFLDPARFAALRAEVEAYRGPILEKAEGRTLLRKVPVTAERARDLSRVTGLRADVALQGLVGYVGARDATPSFYLQSVRQHAGVGAVDPQTLLHADTFHPTVKAWLFLTDVEADAGPFTYVRGSHRLSPERLAWEYTTSLDAGRSPDLYTREGSFRIDEQELAALDLPPPEPIAVPANTLVVADTFGFHARGHSLRPSLRVEVWMIGRRNPFLPWTGSDRVVAALGAVKRGDDHWATREGLSLFDPRPPA